MTLSLVPAPAFTLAEKFRNENAPYFFEDAHFLVEAEAAVTAVEESPNVFRFLDGSRLEIQADRCAVVCHPA